MECRIIFDKKYGKYLGKGSFGTVTQKYDPEFNANVAIKRVKIKDSLNETKGLGLKHKNVLEIYKILSHSNCYDPDLKFYYLNSNGKKIQEIGPIKRDELYIILPLMSTTLSKFYDYPLYKSVNRQNLCKQVIEGNSYLSKYDLYQFDSKSDNILVDLSGTNPIIKITDFGSFENLERLEFNSSIPGTATIWYRPILGIEELGIFASVIPNSIVCAEILLGKEISDFLDNEVENYFDENISKLENNLEKYKKIYKQEDIILYCTIQNKFMELVDHYFVNKTRKAMDDFIKRKNINSIINLKYENVKGSVSLNIPKFDDYDTFITNIKKYNILRYEKWHLCSLMCFLQNVRYLNRDLTYDELKIIDEMLDSVIYNTKVKHYDTNLLKELKYIIKPFTIYDFADEKNIEKICLQILEPNYWIKLKEIPKDNIKKLEKKYILSELSKFKEKINNL